MSHIDQRGIRLATLNVLTLNFPGAESMLALKLKHFGVAVAGVTEARLIGNDSEDIGEGYHLIWSGDQRTETNGVALVLDSRTRRCLFSYEQLSDRILAAQTQQNHGK